MRRLIVTGANGAGKSHVAHLLSEARPDIPLFSFDALKLSTGWNRRPRPEVDSELSEVVRTDAWILEGGPSLLSQALPRAEGIVWLDPWEPVRAWRLISRPWRNYGRTRPELPPGNVDWPLQQYRFALSSLRKRGRFRDQISRCLADARDRRIWHCRSQRQVEVALREWQISGR